MLITTGGLGDIAAGADVAEETTQASTALEDLSEAKQALEAYHTEESTADEVLVNEHEAKTVEFGDEKALILERKKIAYDFYKKTGMNDNDIKAEMRGIDFNKEVQVVELKKGKILQQLQVPGNWQGKYYSEIGAKATKLGINPRGQIWGTKEIAEKLPKYYKVIDNINVLSSHAMPIIDDWSIAGDPYQTIGGDIQYFSKNKDMFMEIDNG